MIKIFSIFILTILFALIPITLAWSQAPDTSWVRLYGGPNLEECWEAQQTFDGGLVIVGSTMPNQDGFYDIYLIRTDAFGEQLWARSYGGNEFDNGRAVRQTFDGGFIVAGYTSTSPDHVVDVYLLKTDQNGDTLWTRNHGHNNYQQGRSIDLCSDGGFIVAGWTVEDSSEQIYVLKTDFMGNEQWTRTFGGDDNERSWSAVQCSDGGYVIAGWTESTFGRMADAYVIKIDVGGDSVWSAVAGGSGNDEARSVVKIPGEGYVIGGKSTGENGRTGFYLLRLDLDGNVISEYILGQDINIVGHSLARTTDRGFVIAGYSVNYNFDYIMKIDSAANVLWTKSVFSTLYTDCRSVIACVDGGYAYAGRRDNDIYLAKLEDDRVSVEGDVPVPRKISLSQNYPNPFNASTIISYELPWEGHVSISIYNLLGEKISTLYNGFQSAGKFDIIWDASAYPSGIYFARLESADISANLKMILLK